MVVGVLGCNVLASLFLFLNLLYISILLIFNELKLICKGKYMISVKSNIFFLLVK